MPIETLKVIDLLNVIPGSDLMCNLSNRRIHLLLQIHENSIGNTHSYIAGRNT